MLVSVEYKIGSSMWKISIMSESSTQSTKVAIMVSQLSYFHCAYPHDEAQCLRGIVIRRGEHIFRNAGAGERVVAR